MVKMFYLSIFLLLNIGCVSESYFMRPRDRVYSKRNLDIYPDVVRLEEEGAKKEAGEGQNCQSSNKNCGSSLGKTDPKAKASNIAQKAAQEAKAANDAQMAAADAAAAQVKSELADKALQSARAAEAALAGKQQIVEQLQSEHTEAQAVVQEVTNSLQNTQTNAAAASDAAVEAKNQVNYLKRLVQAAIANLGQIENVSNGAQQELAEKTQLLEAAKHRVETLGLQLEAAKQDFEKTKKAAYKAACAAVEAKQKAQRNRRRSF
ncbi:uncharacterized protein CG45076-like isoform X3 [Drosophila innubila]|uniref:uncharacterized protein CG45076-like isoform X3 n=1 Tax=Drosophila innubila TaxID=198719 RepID=UPI00148C9D49|nr:uncharacterized protein CG45076-like isoform X3 [Drosophila innubila]